YLPKDTNLVKSAVCIPILDTVIALLAGLAILPAVFSFGLEPTAGPGLIFIILPKVFSSMPFGNIFGIIFFLLVLFAALTSTISLLEVVVSFFVDQLKLDRKKAVILVSTMIGLLAIPNSHSFGPMAEFKVFFGMNFFDFLCYLTDNILLPVGGLMLCIFIGFVWDKEDLKNEISNEGEIKFSLFSAWMIGIKYLGIQLLSLILLGAIGISGRGLSYSLAAVFTLQIVFHVLENKRRLKLAA
ncbi:MAG: sodium-dependent transporter, partial [Cetobacterium sp.]